MQADVSVWGDKSPYIAEEWAEVQNEGLMPTQIEHHPPDFTRKIVDLL